MTRHSVGEESLAEHLSFRSPVLTLITIPSLVMPRPIVINELRGPSLLFPSSTTRCSVGEESLVEHLFVWSN